MSAAIGARTRAVRLVSAARQPRRRIAAHAKIIGANRRMMNTYWDRWANAQVGFPYVGQWATPKNVSKTWSIDRTIASPGCLTIHFQAAAALAAPSVMGNGTSRWSL